MIEKEKYQSPNLPKDLTELLSEYTWEPLSVKQCRLSAFRLPLNIVARECQLLCW